MELVGGGKFWDHLEEAESRERLWQTFQFLPSRSLSLAFVMLKLDFLSDPGVPGVRSMGPVVFH